MNSIEANPASVVLGEPPLTNLYPNLYERRDWGHRELRRVVKSIESMSSPDDELNPDSMQKLIRLNPEAVHRLAHTNPASWSEGVGADLTAGGVSLLGYAYANAYVHTHQGKLPDWGNMSPFTADLLNSLPSFGIQGTVSSTEIIDHSPRLLLGLSALAFGRGFAQGFMQRRLERIRDAQKTLRHAIAAGTVNWDMSEGYTAAFEGSGDPHANVFLSESSLHKLQLAYSRPKGATEWTYLPREADVGETMIAFQRARLERAGVLTFLPSAPTHEFLPGENGYDLSLTRMLFYIGAADYYCEALKIPPKPVLIVGDRKQIDVFITDYPENDEVDEEISGPKIHIRTAQQRLAKFMGNMVENGDDGANKSGVIIIDPTELVIDRIVALAQGRLPVLDGSEQSVGLYRSAFRNAFRGGPYNFDPHNPIKVFYGRTDIPTINAISNAGTEDYIAVLQDPGSRKMLEGRMPPDRILVVPEIVAAAVTPVIRNLRELNNVTHLRSRQSLRRAA